MGAVRFDERHGMVSDFYVLRVKRSNGQLHNECIDRIPNVGDPYDLFQ